MKNLLKEVFLPKVAFVFLLITVAAALVLGSNLFSHNLFVGFEQSYLSKISISQMTGYLVYTSKSQSELESQTLANDFQDGCKYIWQEGDYYFAVYCACERENDALLVKTDIEKKGFPAEVLPLVFDGFVIEGNFSQEEINLLNEEISTFFGCFRTLSDLSVGLKTEVYSSSFCQEKLQKLQENCEKTCKNHSISFKNCQNSKLDTLFENLSNLSLSLKKVENFSQSFAYYAADVLWQYKGLTNKLKA